MSFLRYLKAILVTGALFTNASVTSYASVLIDEHALLTEPDALPAPLRSELPVRPCSECVIPFVMHHPSSLTGIDVSHYQGNINWADVAADPCVRFVYIKATEGSSLRDSYLQRNLQGARSVGLPVGVYHFYSPIAPVKEQLSNFLSTAKIHHQDLIPIVDVEKRGRQSLEVFHRRLHDFLMQVERAYGVKPIIYTYMNFYNRYMVGRYAQYKFMIASYSEDVPELMDDAQMILWQFTAEGDVEGIRTHVDRSRFMDHYSLADILLQR
ncbi:MAG: glycoside hydrolase family 25 protein [Bacteroidaceae bacterium]